MSLRIICAIGGGLLGLTTFSVLGVKLGSWLQSNLSEEEVDAVNVVLRKFGIFSESDLNALDTDNKEEFMEELESVRQDFKN